MRCLDFWWKTPRFCILDFPLKSSLFWEVISNTRHSVSSQYQKPRSSSKILRCASYFISQCLICDETLCLVYDVLPQCHCLWKKKYYSWSAAKNKHELEELDKWQKMDASHYRNKILQPQAKSRFSTDIFSLLMLTRSHVKFSLWSELSLS